ncbi:unnamed protein product [Gadus morhua 'NCC']
MSHPVVGPSAPSLVSPTHAHATTPPGPPPRRRALEPPPRTHATQGPPQPTQTERAPQSPERRPPPPRTRPHPPAHPRHPHPTQTRTDLLSAISRAAAFCCGLISTAVTYGDLLVENVLKEQSVYGARSQGTPCKHRLSEWRMGRGQLLGDDSDGC